MPGLERQLCSKSTIAIVTALGHPRRDQNGGLFAQETFSRSQGSKLCFRANRRETRGLNTRCDRAQTALPKTTVHSVSMLTWCEDLPSSRCLDVCDNSVETRISTCASHSKLLAGWCV